MNGDILSGIGAAIWVALSVVSVVAAVVVFGYVGCCFVAGLRDQYLASRRLATQRVRLHEGLTEAIEAGDWDKVQVSLHILYGNRLWADARTLELLREAYRSGAKTV